MIVYALYICVLNILCSLVFPVLFTSSMMSYCLSKVVPATGAIRASKYDSRRPQAVRDLLTVHVRYTLYITIL